MASLSISSLASFFSAEQKSLERGENHYRSDHAQSFTYSGGIIRGEVKASMKNKSYKVQSHGKCRVTQHVPSSAYHSCFPLCLVIP